MDLTQILQQYCIPLIAAVCYCVCFGVKKAQVLKDKYIPLLAMILGGISGILMNGLSYESVATGIASGAIAVGINQVYKQFLKDDGYTL